MSDEEREPRFFTLTEAERLRVQVEPLLIRAMDSHRRMRELDGQLKDIATRIQLMGGVLVHFEKALRVRQEREKLADGVKSALEQIEATGCLVKDLDTGLLDFPTRLNEEDVYLCWRLGEDRIRFWHRIHEGFAGRKPLDPSDTDPKHPVH